MQKSTVILILLLCLFIWVMSCSGDKSPTTPPDNTLAKLTCVECHTDQAKLMALAVSESPSDGDAGEG